MHGKEKIIDRIRQDGEAAVAQIRDRATAEVEAIAADGAAKAKVEADKVLEEGRIACERIVKNADSADELQLKNALLICRRRQIDKTLAMAIERLCSLTDNEYFDMLVHMASAYSGLSGTVRLNATDLKRVPADFAKRLADVGVVADIDGTASDIVGGFILKCGDIEYCADFAAILEEKRDSLEDMVNCELFVG